ncbi:hypothetical protein FHX75_14245 [Micromonospora palomenae]|uniref:Uncharacterized protein n=1 Tax=Micromonospora palomenae TaxID=1461247 RepID=A0A561VJV8_9ACTN|nr:hypothetical protein FHX75_14245 [Micromonospora palomenae]
MSFAVSGCNSGPVLAYRDRFRPDQRARTSRSGSALACRMSGYRVRWACLHVRVWAGERSGVP